MGRMVLTRKEALLVGICRFVGTYRLEKSDVALVLEHAAGYRALGTDAKDHPAKRASHETYARNGTYDLEVVLALAAIKNWAAEAGVDARRFLTAALRMQCLQERAHLLEEADQARSTRIVHHYSPTPFLEWDNGLRDGWDETVYEETPRSTKLRAEAGRIPPPTAGEVQILAQHTEPPRRNPLEGLGPW